MFKETASGADNARPARAKILAMARAREIDAILVTELESLGPGHARPRSDARRSARLQG